MKSAPFRYHRPGSLAEALERKRDLGADARVLAGGQSLMPLMHFRLGAPEHLLDINGLAELAYIRRQNGHLAIGARTRHAEVLESADAVRSAQLLARAVSQVGHAQIRNRGTVVGSVAHADPSAEIPAAVIALGGEVSAASATGTRTIAAGDLFTGPFTVAIADDEILTELRVPVSPDGAAFVELSRVYHGFPVVGVAALVHLAGGVVDRARVGLCGMAATPVAADVTPLVGSQPTAQAVEAAARHAVEALEPPWDVHGSTAYRKRVGVALIRRALTQAVAEAQTEGGAR